MNLRIITRRWFLKTAGFCNVTLWGNLTRLWAQQSATAIPAVDRKRLVAALGDTLIPTAEGYPGYRRLESHGITDQVLKGLDGLPQADLDLFNSATRGSFKRKSFVELDQAERTRFLEDVVNSFPAGSFGISDFSALTHAERNRLDPATLANETTAQEKSSLSAILAADTLATVQSVFRLVRIRVLTIFYQNFPEHEIVRDQNKIPVLPPDDKHQILNPNTSDLVTGWDVANFPGPLSFAEEEARRAKWMKIHWDFGEKA